MLNEGYLIIDNEQYTPSSFSYQLQPMEDVNQSAAGTDLLNIVRLDKHSFSANWKGITSDLLDILEGLCLKPTVTLVYRGNTYLCRARGANPQLLGKSYKYDRSDGLWDISLTFTEL